MLKKKLLGFREKKLRHNLTDLGNAHNAFRPMLAGAESDMTIQHLPLCCFRRVAYFTASSPLSPKIFFFQAVPGRASFSFFEGLLATLLFLYRLVFSPTPDKQCALKQQVEPNQQHTYSTIVVWSGARTSASKRALFFKKCSF
jgi:hypothetical protein